jgi:pimeloyl-ACP methyl ester carboxylesterase
MRTIDRPGATVAYDVVGEGPAVLLGHSLFCTRRMWRHVVPELEQKFLVVNIELRGHGRSAATAPFTIDDLVEDWLAIMDREQIGRAALCGLSTGGMTAMRLAAREPSRVAGLALLDTNSEPETPLHRLEYKVLGWGYSRFGLLPRKKLASAMYSPRTLSERRHLVEEFIEQVTQLDRRQIGYAMQAVFGRRRIDLSGVGHPSLVVVGEYDAATPPVCARRIADAIEGARLETIPGAGHLTAEEAPEAVLSLLVPFLERCWSAS